MGMIEPNGPLGGPRAVEDPKKNKGQKRKDMAKMSRHSYLRTSAAAPFWK